MDNRTTGTSSTGSVSRRFLRLPSFAAQYTSREYAIDVDIHPIPARPAKDDRPAEPEHDHLDTRYLLVAPPGAREVIGDESIDLRWFTRPRHALSSSTTRFQRLLDIAFAL